MVRRPPNLAALAVDVGGAGPSEVAPKSSGVGPIRSSGRLKSAKRPSPYKRPEKSAGKSPSTLLGAQLDGMALISARAAGPRPPPAADSRLVLRTPSDAQPISARTRARLQHSFGKSGLAFVEAKLRNAALHKR